MIRILLRLASRKQFGVLAWRRLGWRGQGPFRFFFDWSANVVVIMILINVFGILLHHQPKLSCLIVVLNVVSG